MTVAAPSVLMDELVEMIGAAWDTSNVQYGPPESKPTYEMAWVRYGERTFEYGITSVEHPSVVITVAAPSNGDYPGEYRIVNDITNTIAMALLQDRDSTDPVKVGELSLDGITVSEPSRSDYAGEPGAIMAAAITLDFHSKEMNL
jgi:hypothetical protein